MIYVTCMMIYTIYMIYTDLYDMYDLYGLYIIYNLYDLHDVYDLYDLYDLNMIICSRWGPFLSRHRFIFYVTTGHREGKRTT